MVNYFVDLILILLGALMVGFGLGAKHSHKGKH